ncbi:MAG: hypothetical protein WDA02_07975 [Saccharofermentanales bacterium]|jgi:hypothetical protein
MENKMNDIAKEIISLKFNDTDTISDCKNKFYDIMSKYNISQTTPHYNDDGEVISRTGANYDWTMCKYLFLEMIQSQLSISMLFDDNIPQNIK